MIKNLTTPLTEEAIKDLKAGDMVTVTGTVFTARDAAHKRLTELISQGKELPLDLKGQIIYYAGPTPEKPGCVIGSIGPTTSGRMDPYAPTLMEKCGLKGIIGKGQRNLAVRQAIKDNNCVYMAATGGAGALLRKHITDCQIIAYEDLGCEAIRKLTVDHLPALVINDSEGNDFYRKDKI